MSLEKAIVRERPGLVPFARQPIRTIRKARVVEQESSSAAHKVREVEQAIRRWGDMILRLALCKTNNREDAEDITQTVFMKLFQRSADFDSDEHMKAWLLRVTLNSANDLHRSPWNRIQPTLRDADEQMDEIVDPKSEEASQVTERVLSEALVSEAVAALPEKQRIAVHLYYYEDYPIKQIASIMDEQASTVRSHIHRARKTLRSILGGNNA